MVDMSDPDWPRGVGRRAWTPRQIPPAGWWQIIKRVWRYAGANNLGLAAAGVAFYGLLALFPALAALISLYGLMADPNQVAVQFATLKPVLPSEAYDLLNTQLRDLAARPVGSLGAGFAGAVLLSVWSATKGTRSLIGALNIAYDERERRSLLRVNLLAFGMTAFLIVLCVLVLVLVVALPVALNLLGLGAVTEMLMRWLRWPVLAAMLIFTLAVLYRYAPSRRLARWRWVSWGSGLAVLLWLAASGAFSLYVSRFADYNATYGSVGAVTVLLMWLFLSAFAVLLGGQLNAEMERQTGHDTTHHGIQPRGKRGAYVADHLPGNAHQGN